MIVSDSPPNDNADPREDADRPEDEGQQEVENLCEGERRRDEALGRLRRNRRALIRRIQREFLRHLLNNGPATSDAVRRTVPIPRGTDPRIVGSAVRGLSEQRLIVSVDIRKSHRPVAHSRMLVLWDVPDEAEALIWLHTHPDLFPSDPGEVQNG